ncbi:type II toxin-antitoxin system RelE/ParE family toxin [Myxococcota bacterium]
MYRVQLTRAAARDLRGLPRGGQRRIDAAIMSLAEHPRPPGCVKLRGADDLYRVRVGDYRIVYQIEDEVLTVLVIRIGHRRDVYRGR